MELSRIYFLDSCGCRKFRWYLNEYCSVGSFCVYRGMSSRRAIFEGRVQGVGFRYTAKDLAKGYDLVGTVRNCEDGTVELILQGEYDEITSYLEDLAENSEVAHHVQDMRVEEIAALQDLKGFTIVS